LLFLLFLIEPFVFFFNVFRILQQQQNSEDILSYASMFDEVIDSDDERISKDPLSTPNIAEMISPAAGSEQSNQDFASSFRDRAESVTDNETVSLLEKPKRKRRWRKKPDGWVDEPKSKKKPGHNKEHANLDDKVQSQPLITTRVEEPSSKDRCTDEDDMVGSYVYCLDDSRRRPARVLSHKRGHALVEFIGGRSDAKSWIPVSSKWGGGGGGGNYKIKIRNK
jgi:hypothetical protein